MMKLITTSRRMKYLLVALVALVILDGIITQFVVGNGTAWELNPFLAPMVGETGFMILKVVGSLLCALILWDIHRRLPRLGIIVTWVAVIGYAAIILWNTSLILIV